MTDDEAIAWLADPDNWEAIEGNQAFGIRGCDVPGCDANDEGSNMARDQCKKRWRFNSQRPGHEKMLTQWISQRNPWPYAHWAIVRCEKHYAELKPKPTIYPELDALHELHGQ